MAKQNPAAAFTGDLPAAALDDILPDRSALNTVAVERSRMPMVVTDPRRVGNPIVLANKAFLDLTGYTAREVLNRNCKFLQGSGTEQDDIVFLAKSLATGTDHIEIELLNYRKDGTTFWNQLAIDAVRDDAGALLYYLGSQKDVTLRREAQKLEAAERRLLKEVDHRAMNALALVQSIVRLSRADSIDHFSATVQGRVDALARAHRILGSSGWTGAGLNELIAGELDGVCAEPGGPTLLIPSHLVQPFSIVLHELAQNAREHGALRHPEADLRISWEFDPLGFILEWKETKSPASSAHVAAGMGLKLLRATVQAQLGGRLDEHWQDDGLTFRFHVPWER